MIASWQESDRPGDDTSSRSVVSDSVTPCTVAHQAPLSMGFSRQEYWRRLPFHSSGDLPDPGIEPRFPTLQADSLPSEPPGKFLLKSGMCAIHWFLLIDHLIVINNF